MNTWKTDRVVLQAAGQRLLEEARVPSPFNEPANNAIMTACITAIKNHSPFFDRPHRNLQNNPALWKATWEDLFMVMDEVLREES